MARHGYRYDTFKAASAAVEQAAGDRHVAHQSPYLDAHEAAAYLKYGSVLALYKAVKQFGIPHRRRSGRTLLFVASELDAWLLNRGARHGARSVARVSARGK